MLAAIPPRRSKEKTMKRNTIVAVALVAGIGLVEAARAQTPKATPAATAPAAVRPNFVDANGDGVCDNCSATPQARGRRAGRTGSGFGPGDGTGNQGLRPRDGSGYGQRQGRGSCPGNGHAGRGRGGRRP
jgi:hypothetical protein